MTDFAFKPHKKDVVNVRRTTPDDSRYETWKVSYNGNVLGDSRGYDKKGAIDAARKHVAKDPDYYELHPDLK